MSSTPEYTFQYASHIVPAQPRVDLDAPMFASEDGVVASLSNNECVFQVKRSGDTHVMTFQVLQALDQSREFRSLPEHVAHIQARVPGLAGQREGVQRVLDNLVSRGLLISDRDFLRRVAAAPATDPAPFRGAFIRACDRPEQLATLLGSLADYERHFRAGRHYVVLDDSRTRAAIDRNRDLVREFARATGCKLTLIGASERAKLVDRLARAVPQAASILPHLLGSEDCAAAQFGGGRSWNLALLLSAGARFVLFDDDQRLPLRKLDDARIGLDPNPASRATTRFYRNIENALGAGEEMQVDPFELHLAAAGRPLGALVSTSDYTIDRNSLRGLALSRLDHLDGGAPVRVTQQGAYGSSRTESGIWLYHLPPEDRAEFVRDRDSYLRNVEAGSIWHGYRQAHAATTVSFTPFALDNSIMLPCTNPFGRGEDALFSQVLALCHDGALALELPVAIGHVQETQRKRSTHTLSAHTPRFNYFVGDFVRRQLPEFNAEDPAQRMALLAAHVRDIGSANAKGCVRQLQEYLAFVRADMIERLQQQYDAAPDAPVWWQADVRTIIEANGRALVSKAAPRLGDWPEAIDEAGCVDRLRNDTSRLAATYEAWPALWRHAQEQGTRLLGAV